VWNLIVWIVLGGLAGWLASIVTGRNQRQGCLMNVIVGVIGAFIGGVIYNLLTGQGLSFSFGAFDIGSIWGFVVAVGGAIVLLLVVNLFTRR
jgi:uncharacterized membrane protein YeaQ/YmgE (transglycosylase-associated protein family)